MKLISTRTHGMLDYGVGILLILAPFLLGFATGGPAMWVPILLGIATLVYSAMTAYELGLARVLPMPAHLTLDFLSGAFLALSPWLFGFAEIVAAPHVIVGLLEIVAALMTQRRPAYTTVQNAPPHRA